MKSKYQAPKILNNIILEIESEILSGSVVVDEKSCNVESTGQEIVNIDMSDFSSNWE